MNPCSGSSANNININLGGATLSVLICLMVVIGACGVIMGMNLAKQSQMDRDFRDMQIQGKITERRLIDIENYAARAGWKQPGDDIHGPAGHIIKPEERK